MTLKTFCMSLFFITILLTVLPHCLWQYQIKKLKIEIQHRQSIIKKQPVQTFNHIRVLHDVRAKQLFFLQLFVLMSQSPLEWQSIIKEENIVLKGAAFNFSDIKKFVFTCHKNHIPLSLQKIQTNERLEFQFLVRVKNHAY